MINVQLDAVDLLAARGSLGLSYEGYGFSHASYESLLALLRRPLLVDVRARVQAELRSRDRAYNNQWVQQNGGQLR